MDFQNLIGKTAVVTGSSRGIGRAIAKRLAENGAAVTINYRNDAVAAEELVAQIVASGGLAQAVQGDMAKIDDIQRLFDKAEIAFGPIDIVVANAGIAILKPVIDCTEEDFDRLFSANTRGVFFTLKEAAKRLRDGGRIVAISSGGTRMFLSDTSLYLGSKGAVEQFVRALSRELGSRGITVNAVLPGFTNTDMLPEQARAIAADMSPLARVGETDDIADIVAFLASERARWVTGQNIGAGGGVM